MDNTVFKRRATPRADSRWRIACVICLTAFSSPALSHDRTGEDAAREAKSYQLAVGVGAYVSTNPYIGDDEEVQGGVIPYIVYENRWMSLSPEGLAVKAVRDSMFSVDLVASPRWTLVDPDDIDALNGIDREIGLDLGARLGVAAGRFEADIVYLADVTDKSSGHEVTAALGAQLISTQRFVLGVEAGATWRDENLSTYLHGVLPEDAASGFSPYAIDSTVTPFVGIQASYRMTRKVSIVAGVRGELYPDGVTDSPIIAKDGGADSFLAMIYSF